MEIVLAIAFGVATLLVGGAGGLLLLYGGDEKEKPQELPARKEPSLLPVLFITLFVAGMILLYFWP